MQIHPYGYGGGGTTSPLSYSPPGGGDARAPGDLHLLRRAQNVTNVRRAMLNALRRPTVPNIPYSAPLRGLGGRALGLGRLAPPLRYLDLLLTLLELTRDPLLAPFQPGGYDADLIAAGWSLICDVGPGTGLAYCAWAPNNPNLICDPLAVDVPFIPYGTDLPAVAPFSRGWIEFGQKNDIGTVGRMGRNVCSGHMPISRPRLTLYGTYRLSLGRRYWLRRLHPYRWPTYRIFNLYHWTGGLITSLLRRRSMDGHV